MKLIALVLVAGTTLALATPARAASDTAAPTPHVMTPSVRPDAARDLSGKAEKHPEIRAAIRALERAKSELEHASHDFGGHRADAIRSVDESIRQLRLALQYDKK